MHGVDANVEVNANGDAHVTLTIRLLVNRGRLRGMELAGLRDAALDSKKVVFKSDKGVWTSATLFPQPNGRYRLEFERSDALMPGNYKASIEYKSKLTKRRVDSNRVRMSWTLPGWETGLDDVNIRIYAPKGATPVDATPLEGTYTVEHKAARGRQVMLWRKPHQPRISPWTVAFEVSDTTTPAVTPAQPTETNNNVGQLDPTTDHRTDPIRGQCIATLLLGLLALRRRKKLALQLRPLLHLNFVSAAVAIGLSVALSYWLPNKLVVWVWIAVAMLGVYRTHRTLLPAIKGERKSFNPVELRSNTDVSSQILDPTTPCGMALLTAMAMSVSSLLSAADAALFTAIIFSMSATGTRFHKRLGHFQSWKELDNVMEYRTPLLGKQTFAMQPQFVLDQYQNTEVRLSLSSQHQQPGLESIDLLVMQTPFGGALLPQIFTWITTRAATSADDLVKTVLRTPTQTDGRTRAWLVPLQSALPILEAITSANQRDSTPWLLRAAKTNPRPHRTA